MTVVAVLTDIQRYLADCCVTWAVK